MHDPAPKCHGKFVFEPSPQGYCFHCTFLWGGHVGSHCAVPGDHPETWRFKTAKFFFPERQCWVQEMPAQVPHTAGITTFTILLTSQRVSIAARMHTHIKPCLVSMATSPSSYTSWRCAICAELEIGARV